jgi:uncharacterized protein (TIGR03086 family)
MDMLSLYGRASEWALGKIAGATAKMDAATPCDEWTVRDLLNHMLETQQFFVSTARKEDGQPPSPNPPELLSDSPVDDFEHARSEVLSAFSEDGVIARTGPSLGIAFSDQLLHGWDVAKATGQDATMPDGLAEAAYEIIHGRFTDEQRKGVFGPEIAVPASASAQDRLLAYTGRNPSR